MAIIQRLNVCLWFDTQAEAANFYTSVFPNSRIVQVARYPGVGQEVHGKPEGSVMVVEFVLDGVTFTALNGGPAFRFTEAVSFQILCKTQQEINHYWEKLGEGGDPAAQVCGWLKDKYGLSWQVAPAEMGRWLADHKSEGTRRYMAALMKMKKLDLAELERAFEGP